MIKLFAFLGNYEPQYENTRHNAGFFCADHLSCLSNTLWQQKFLGSYTKLVLPDEKNYIHCIKPYTYMNASGNSILQVMNFFKIQPEQLLVFHDELQLPTASISLKYGGGLAGHNGLRSIFSKLGTQNFWRVRIGIDRPTNKNIDIADYVLSKFTDTEYEYFFSMINDLDKLVL